MTSDHFNPVVVLRTGQVWQFDMAVDALKAAGIPHMAEEETVGGLRLAMPVAPAPGPGVFWSLRVPAAEEEKAKRVLSELPFEIKTDPGPWDFEPPPSGKKVRKVLLLVALVVVLTLALLGLLRLFL